MYLYVDTVHHHQTVNDVSFPFQDWDCVVEVYQPMNMERIAAAAVNDLWTVAIGTSSSFEQLVRAEPDMTYR